MSDADPRAPRLSEAQGSAATGNGVPAPLLNKFAHALERLEKASSFAKYAQQQPVVEIAQRVLAHPGGVESLFAYAARMDTSGLFKGSDWDNPATLLPGLVQRTLMDERPGVVVLEFLNQLRLLAVARGLHVRPGLSAEQAQHFLTQVLALNLSRVCGRGATEEERVRLGALAPSVDELFQFLLAHIGFRDILSHLVDEVWRILAQRPVLVDNVKGIITQVAITLAEGAGDLGKSRLGADRLISALFGPTQTCQDDPGLARFRARLSALDQQTLQQEAHGFARAMHDSGLVSDYHADFLRWVMEEGHSWIVPDALGLGPTGREMLRCFPDLVHRLIEDAIHPETSQAVYGLSLLLERGILYSSPIVPALWRQVALVPSPTTEALIAASFGGTLPARVHLLAGMIMVLGQPLGIGQGNNPSCQAARAVSMWSYNDPDYLLHLVAQAARSDGIRMHFEGKRLDSASLPPGLVGGAPLDTDPVSLLLVPHLDRVYAEMGRLCAGRAEDPHRWINPELHGWWVGNNFVIAVDVETGKLEGHDAFLERFHSSYHPHYNGGQPVIHPQPAGLAVTDSNAAFIGWHAITLIRVSPDQDGVMRVYFYNPNNDSGQNWGHGVVVSTQGHGERFGEASLPFPELASRLYIFHDDPVESAHRTPVPAEVLEPVRRMALESWAATRVPSQE